MSDLDEEVAQNLLVEAIFAKESGNWESSLDKYSQSLEKYLTAYRITPDGTPKKVEILKIIENSMTEAENIKLLISQRDQIMSQASFSSPRTNSTTNTKPNTGTKATVDKKKANFLPDYFDFSAPRKKAEKTTLPIYTTPMSASTASAANTSASRPNPTSGTAASNRKPVGTAPVAPNGKPSAASTNTNDSAAAPHHKKASNEYVDQIMDEIVDKSPQVRWDDIAGLSFAKQTLQETVILPNLRPDIFTGLRRPPKGVLLYGPPGTGKTMLAKAVATESGFVFFSISAASVTSKYLGEGEKLMRALFEIAREKQPAVIFIDEIDALMSIRKDNEHEASRRLKTEFMTQMDGAASSGEERILIMGATNIPWDIDEAVLRRLTKRIYVPLPDGEARKALVQHMLTKQGVAGGGIGPKQLDNIVKLTEGYSGSDLTAVVQEAALCPIRDIGTAALRTVKAEDVRPITVEDFIQAVKVIRPSVSGDNLKTFKKWSDQFGIAR